MSDKDTPDPEDLTYGYDIEEDKAAAIEAADPPVAEPFPETCAMCGKPYHKRAATEKDEYELVCPGDDAREETKAFYVLQREFAHDAQVAAQKAQDLLNEDPQGAYEARQRADGVAKEDLPDSARVSVGLQADCDARVEAIVPTQPWLNVKGVDQVVAQIAADEAAEAAAGNLDIQDRHLTVPGKVPTTGPALTRRRLGSAPAGGEWQQEKLSPVQKAAENDSMLFLNPNVDE